MASLGLLDDAASWFRPGQGVGGAGVLLAVPALLGSGVIDLAHEVYGRLAPAFYGLRTTVLTLRLMALLRIRRPEGLKGHAPQELGRILGLDQAPEVKTLRRKLTRLASVRRSGVFGRELAKRRVAQYSHVMGFLYVDGHVRAYHGNPPDRGGMGAVLPTVVSRSFQTLPDRSRRRYTAPRRPSRTFARGSET